MLRITQKGIKNILTFNKNLGFGQWGPWLGQNPNFNRLLGLALQCVQYGAVDKGRQAGKEMQQ